MTTITEALTQLRVPTAGPEHRHGRLGWTQLDCPWCGSGTGKFHLGINTGGWANCWRCGPHTLYEVLLEITHDASDVRQILDDLQLRRGPTTKRPTKGRLVRPVGLAPLGRAHIAYLRRRALNPNTASQLWGAQGIGLAARLRWRLYIPIYYHGVEVSWTTRAISPKAQRRYITASPEEESMPSKGLLYGADYARSAIIVHEGPLDVWRTGPGAVALFGLNYTRAQVAAMVMYPLRVICLDNEERAQAVAGRLADELSVFPGRTVRVQLESGEDPGSADEEELAELRKRFLD